MASPAAAPAPVPGRTTPITLPPATTGRGASGGEARTSVAPTTGPGRAIAEASARNNGSSTLQGVHKVGTLEEAVRTAAQVAQPGDVVLLSPGGTSFDAFQDFEERGERFKELVHGLKSRPAHAHQ